MQHVGRCAPALIGYHRKEAGIGLEKRAILCYESGSWVSQDAKAVAKRDFTATYRLTVEQIVLTNPDEMPRETLLFWICTFNAATTSAALLQKKIKPIPKSEDRAQFNSMNKYAWLSNFFPSIIYDSENSTIYPTLESGYVAFKARQAGYGRDVVDSLAHIIDPKQAKRAGADLWNRISEEDNAAAIGEMGRLAKLKFDQNPVIAQWLKTSTAALEEFTSDGFWGSCLGTCLTEDSNHLGRIIEGVREQLQ